MANIGRFVCVLLPFALTLASLIAMLVAGLAGMTDKSLYMFEVNTTNLQISASDAAKILNIAKRESVTLETRDPLATTLHSPNIAGKATSSSSSTNITAEDLGIGELYYINIWNYCEIDWNSNNTLNCTKGSFNYAGNLLNTSTSTVDSLITSSGYNVTLPSGVTDGLKAFETVSKWTQIVFIIAYVALGVELFFGLFANCSRAFSCVTFLVAMFAAVATCAASALATVMSAVIVGTLEGTARWYGVTASMNTRFLATIWIGAAFAIGAGFFWMFTICCCAPDHNSRRSRGPRTRHVDPEGEKLVGGAYAPIHPVEPSHHQAQPYNNSTYAQPPQTFYSSGANGQHGQRRDLAYEPYSHANV